MRLPHLSKEEQRFAWLMVLVGSGCVMALGVFVFALRGPHVQPAVYITSPTRVLPNPAEVCPGEMMSYTVQIDIQVAPSQVMIVETVWSVDMGHTIIFDESPIWAAYTDPVRFAREFIYTVPQLEPGQYELRSVAQEFSSKPSAYSVPFTVRGDC